MSPMVRSRSRATTLLKVFLLVAVLGVALSGGVAQAQDGGGDSGEAQQGEEAQQDGEAAQDGGFAYDYVLTVRQSPLTESDPFAFDIEEFTVPANSQVALVYDSTGATALHNAQPRDVPEENIQQTAEVIDADQGQSFSVFTLPESGEVEYFCAVHPDMTGTITIGETFQSGEPAGAGGGGGEDITHQGVHFLAHWVGVIAFAVLFIVYGATFFLFKYNESAFATDHKDRATPAGGGAGATDRYGQDVRITPSTAVVLTLLLVILAIGLVYLFAQGTFSG